MGIGLLVVPLQVIMVIFVHTVLMELLGLKIQQQLVLQLVGVLHILNLETLLPQVMMGVYGQDAAQQLLRLPEMM